MIELPAFDALALSLHHAPGTQALLVGSGLSSAAGIPTGWQITLDLIRRLAALKGVTEHEDWEKWFKTEHGGKAPNYSELMDTLASTPAERRNILHGYIEPQADDDDRRRPTKAHQAIARLVKAGAVRVIVTPNFDRLIENALRDEGIEPTVIASEDAVHGAEPLVHARCTVIKVHGDYLDTRIKNTDNELAAYGTAMNALLDQVFDNFGLTVVGWSGDWDTALRDAIVRQPNRRFPLYWAARGAVGPFAHDLLTSRGGRSFPISDADSFFVKLEQQVEALKQAARPHPQSIDMAIALARRYCRDDRFGMEWVALLHEEGERIRAFLAGPNFPTDFSKASWNKFAQEILERTEVLRRSCLICGRWGTEEANRAVSRQIKKLTISDEFLSGFTALNSLRNMAASIVFYWNLFGLLERSSYALIRNLMFSETPVHRERDLFIEVLPFACYSDNNWKWLSGLENRKTPISDFMFNKIEDESNDLSMSRTQANTVFDQTEILICIMFAHQRLKRMSSSSIWFWMPVGRFIWKDGNMLLHEIDRIASLPESDALFQAKVIGKNSHEFKATAEKIREEYPNHRREYR